MLTAHRLFWLGLILLVLSGAGLAIHMGETTRYVDEADFDQLARSVVAGQGFSFSDGVPTAYRPPAYPFSIAAVYAAGGNRVAARLVNVAWLALAALLIAALARAIDPASAFLTPWLVLAFPVATYTAATLYPQTAGALLLAAALLLVGRRPPSPAVAFGAGLLFGLLCLFIPGFIMLAPLLVLAAAVGERGAWVRPLRGALAAIGIVLAVLPWTARNYVRMHAVIPVSTNSGINLALGNSPMTHEDSGVRVDVQSWCPLPPGADRDEVARDRTYRDCALHWIRTEPAAAAQLYVRKLVYWFSPTNSLASLETGAAVDWAMRLTYGPLLLLIVLRPFFWRRHPLHRAEWLLYAFYVAGAFTSALFFSRVRFRVPFDLVMIPVVAPFLLHLSRRILGWPADRPGAGGTATD